MPIRLQDDAAQWGGSNFEFRFYALTSKIDVIKGQQFNVDLTLTTNGGCAACETTAGYVESNAPDLNSCSFWSLGG
jgi:hypothetical protein